MARSNTGSSSNRFTSTSIPVTVYPFTVSCWFNPANLTSTQNLVFISNTGVSEYFGILYDGSNAYGLGDNVVIANAYEGNAVSPTGGTANAWNHAAGVFTSLTSRTAYLNGSGGTANTANRTFGTMNNLFVGGLSTFSPMNGAIAEVGFWNVALDAAEIASLADGASPLMIRPNNLVRYWPLYGVDTETCRITGQTLTTTGTMAKAAHVPNVLEPALPIIGIPSTSSAKTVTVDTAAYAVTNTAISLEIGRKAAVDAASYTLTNTAISLERGYKVVVDNATYAITNTAVNFSRTYKLAIASATYAISNTAISLERGYPLAVASVSYAVGNTAISLLRGYEVAVDNATYNVTNTAIAFSRSYKLAVASASYAITNSDITLTYQPVGELSLAVDSATYSVNNADISLERGFKLAVAATSYAVTNANIGVLRGREIEAANANYTITNSDITLTKASAPGLLSVEPASYTTSFSEITLVYGRISRSDPDAAPSARRQQQQRVRILKYQEEEEEKAKEPLPLPTEADTPEPDDEPIVLRGILAAPKEVQPRVRASNPVQTPQIDNDRPELMRAIARKEQELRIAQELEDEDELILLLAS